MIVKSNKTYSSGRDERYSYQNNTELNNNFKARFAKNLEYVYLLYMLHDEQMSMYSKLKLLENYRLFDSLNHKSMHYNISAGGLFHTWEFDFD